ncbi:DUF349 domain-containing protein [Allohahella sp. A8]|uniref:DUF349 domain-containing protein n=1 Tax=Allohahella sp. A8 TaxID=3141461 RepID=UPI003A800C6A
MPSILSRLFKPRWQHADPTIRAEALSQLEWAREADRKILLQVLAEDSAEQVVAAGLAQIRDAGVLLNFAGHPEPSIAGIAERHITSLKGEALTALIEYFEQNFAQLDEARQSRLLHLLLTHEQSGLQSQALLDHAANCNEACVAHVAMHHPRGQVRQQAAALLSNVELLEQTAQVLRRKDKGAYAIVRKRIDSAKSRAEALNQSLQGLSGIAHELEAMIQSESWYRLDERLPGLRKRFQDLTAAGPADDAQLVELTRRVSELLGQAEQLVQRVDRKLALKETIEALHQTLDQLEASPPTANQAPALAALISTQTTRWANACEEAAYDKPPADLAKAFDEAMGRLETMQQSLMRASQAAQAEAELEAQAARAEKEEAPSEEQQEAARVAAARAQAVAELRDRLGRHKTELAALLAQCEQALEDGQTSQAAQQLKDFDERVTAIESAAGDAAGRDGIRLTKEFVRSLDAERRTLGQKLHELRTWASFATQPKQEALLEQAERLDSMSVAPRDKAQRMKALREEWNQLGPCPDKRLYGRFQSVMNSIQKSCSAYFEEEKRLRALNKQKREEILAALGKLMEQSDPKDVELSALETIVERSKKEWRAAFPVDRRDEKNLQSAFDALIAQVEAPLITARETGKAGRLALIEEIATLLESSSDGEVEQVTNAVKAAQARWKALPQTWRKDDRQLWLQFRALCDKSFERRSEVAAGNRDSRRQFEQAISSSLDTQAKRLSHLVTQLKAEALSTSDRQALESELSAVEAEIRAVGSELRAGAKNDAGESSRRASPSGRGTDSKLEKRVDMLLAEVNDARKHLESSQTEAVWRKLVQFARALGDDRESGAASDPESLLSTVVQKVFGSDQSADWLDKAHILHEARRLLGELEKGADAQLLAASLRQSIVRAEIATGVDSPAADQPVRMSLQMQRLAEIGQRNRPAAEAAYSAQRGSPAELEGFPETLLTEFERGAAAVVALQSLDAPAASDTTALSDLFTTRWQNLHARA